MGMKKFIDIAANLTDPMFQGIYNNSKKHEADLIGVLSRSWANGLEKIIITGTTLEDSKQAYDLAKTDKRLYLTVGCHPTKCNEFEKSGDPNQYLQSLESLVKNAKSKVVAFGECGLDYDRLHFCPKEIQLKYFERQLALSKSLSIPLFLHCRNAHSDLLNLLEKYKPEAGGVVHSFDGTIEEAISLIDSGFYIGINGCSLKTESNLQAVKAIPIDRLVIETDCPWCEIRPTHAGAKFVRSKFDSVKKEKWKNECMVKNRNEPSNIIQVLEVIAAVKSEDIDDLCLQIYNNTFKVFPNLQ